MWPFPLWVLGSFDATGKRRERGGHGTISGVDADSGLGFVSEKNPSGLGSSLTHNTYEQSKWREAGRQADKSIIITHLHNYNGVMFSPQQQTRLTDGGTKGRQETDRQQR